MSVFRLLKEHAKNQVETKSCVHLCTSVYVLWCSEATACVHLCTSVYVFLSAGTADCVHLCTSVYVFLECWNRGCVRLCTSVYVFLKLKNESPRLVLSTISLKQMRYLPVVLEVLLASVSQDTTDCVKSVLHLDCLTNELELDLMNTKDRSGTRFFRV